MAEYRINSQNDTIKLILKALKELSVGIGFSVICDIEVVKGKDSSTIIFKTKDERKIKHSDFFMLGYFVGRDFEEKVCDRCKKVKI